QPVREIGAQLERLSLDRRAILFAGRRPAREELVALRFVVRHLDPEDLQQLARRVHRTAVPAVLLRVHVTSLSARAECAVVDACANPPGSGCSPAMDTTLTRYDEITASLPKGYRAREFRDSDREPMVAERNE